MPPPAPAGPERPAGRGELLKRLATAGVVGTAIGACIAVMLPWWRSGVGSTVPAYRLAELTLAGRYEPFLPRAAAALLLAPLICAALLAFAVAVPRMRPTVVVGTGVGAAALLLGVIRAGPGQGPGPGAWALAAVAVLAAVTVVLLMAGWQGGRR